MRLLIIGDLHLKLNYLTRAKSALKQLHNIAQETDITVFLGDQYDSKAVIRSEIQNLFIETIKNWPNKCYILIGNHDMESLSKDAHHSMEPLKLLDNVHIVDKYMVQGNLVFFSYMDNEEFLERISHCAEKDADILFAHQGVDGFMYSNGIREQSSIKPKHLSQFKKAILGHLHAPQEKNNIIYVGTPYTTNFGEANEEKRVIIYDTEKDTIENIKLDIPQHRQYQFNIDSMDKIKEIQKVLKNDTNSIIQIIATVPIEIADKINKKTFKIPNLVSLKKVVIMPKKQVQIKETLSPEKMVNKYIDIVDTEIDKKELKELNRKVLSNV